MSSQTGGMTDVTGYRSDSGSLGQDQQVSGQIRSILTSKLPLLSSPGTVIENSLYYDVSSSSVSAVEMQETFAKDRITLSSANFQTAASAYIPSQLFAGTCFWVAQLPNIIANATTRAAQDSYNNEYRFYAPQGWGFNALQSIIVYMGASSIAQIEIDSYANLMVNLASCETKGKRQAMLQGAGRLMDNYTACTILKQVTEQYPAPGQSVLQRDDKGQYNSFRNLTSPVGSLTNGAGNLYTYYLPSTTVCVPIRLPFTSMSALAKKLSLDTKLLTQPIQITLQTKAFNQIFTMGSRLIQPSQWQNSTLQLWQEELSDKSLSVRNELLAMPEYNVGYPFQYIQSIPFSFPPNDAGFPNITFNGNMYNQQSVTMNITSIINSDLTTMLFMITNGTRSDNQPFTPSGCAGNYTQFCPNFGEEISNVQLLLNGQRFFAFDQGVYDAATVCKQLDEVTTTMLMPYVALPAGTQINQFSQQVYTNTSKPSSATFFREEQSRIYELNFSRIRALMDESHLQNTARFTNQTFQLTFNIERGNNYICTPIHPDTNSVYKLDQFLQQTRFNMTMRMAFCYNGVFLIGGDGGTTKLVTN
jgi:hypothetical protein